MTHQLVDLSAHINQTVERGHPADFPVALRPVFFEEDGVRRDVPRRFVVVREDSGVPSASSRTGTPSSRTSGSWTRSP